MDLENDFFFLYYYIYMQQTKIDNNFTCTVSIYFAYTALVYILASIFYIIFTRQYGTPFMDAVNKYPTLVEIKKESSKKRRNIFIIGIIINITIVLLIRPFKNCIN